MFTVTLFCFFSQLKTFWCWALFVPSHQWSGYFSDRVISTAEGERHSCNTSVRREAQLELISVCVFCVLCICVLSWKLRCSQAKCEGYVRQSEKEWDKDLRAHRVNSCRASWTERKKSQLLPSLLSMSHLSFFDRRVCLHYPQRCTHYWFATDTALQITNKPSGSCV